MVVIGVTGIMGSGKTTVSRMFCELGARVIDADSVARQLMSPFEPGWWNVCEYFGQGIVDRSTSEIDRLKLGSMVFNDPYLLKRLNSLVHPLVIREIGCLAREKTSFGAMMTVHSWLKRTKKITTPLFCLRNQKKKEYYKYLRNHFHYKLSTVRQKILLLS